MWPGHVWFMWSWGRLCLIWPITDGLACSMFLFPQCHSHNPSPRAEPKACLAVIICRVFASLRMCEWVCVCSCGYTVIWRWRAPVQLCMHVTCNAFVFFLVTRAYLFLREVWEDLFVLFVVSRSKRQCQADWAAIGDQYGPGSSPLISHGVFYQQWSELGAELSKQPAHLGVCFKLLGFVFFGLHIIFHCTSFRSMSCFPGQYLCWNSSDLLSLSLI